MKKTDLEKNKGLKLVGKMNQGTAPGRFGQPAAALPDKREQRKRDQALGLVPFAVKLDSALVKQLQSLAEERAVPLTEVVTEVLRRGLGE